MIILIAGCSHTGKTALAQKLMEQYHYPYLSIDILKMGLIRSKTISATVQEDEKLTNQIWPILQQMIKTAIENEQNMIIEGCYIPFQWQSSFEKSYLKHIRYYCLIMTQQYIHTHIQDIKKYANIIEKRIDDSYYTKEMLLKENALNLYLCKKYHLNYILIDQEYKINIQLSPK